MKLIDTPYTICSCPTPENGGGCTLTNWYYYGRSNESLLPNTGHFGRRTDEAGSLMPCRYFPVRAKRQCMGCGCDHGRHSPRDMEYVLTEADRALAAHRRRAPA